MFSALVRQFVPPDYLSSTIPAAFPTVQASLHAENESDAEDLHMSFLLPLSVAVAPQIRIAYIAEGPLSVHLTTLLNTFDRSLRRGWKDGSSLYCLGERASLHFALNISISRSELAGNSFGPGLVFHWRIPAQGMATLYSCSVRGYSVGTTERRTPLHNYWGKKFLVFTILIVFSSTDASCCSIGILQVLDSQKCTYQHPVNSFTAFCRGIFRV